MTTAPLTRCPRCKGTGRTVLGACHPCSGTGQVVDTRADWDARARRIRHDIAEEIAAVRRDWQEWTR